MASSPLPRDTAAFRGLNDATSTAAGLGTWSLPLPDRTWRAQSPSWATPAGGFRRYKSALIEYCNRLPATDRTQQLGWQHLLPASPGCASRPHWQGTSVPCRLSLSLACRHHQTAAMLSVRLTRPARMPRSSCRGRSAAQALQSWVPTAWAWWQPGCPWQRMPAQMQPSCEKWAGWNTHVLSFIPSITKRIGGRARPLHPQARPVHPQAPPRVLRCCLRAVGCCPCPAPVAAGLMCSEDAVSR